MNKRSILSAVLALGLGVAALTGCSNTGANYVTPSDVKTVETTIAEVGDQGVKVMMFLVATLTTIGCLKIFTEVYLLGGSASPTKTLTMYIRDRIVDPTFGSLGQGDAASVCLFLITFGFIIASQSLQRKAEES